MAKRIVNKAERNAERYDAKEIGYQLYEDSLKGKIFERLMPMIISEQNIILLSKDVSELVGAEDGNKIGKLLENLPLTNEMQEKINKLREHRELEIIQFEDYISTKK